MIPPRLMKSLAEQLTQKTRRHEVKWRRVSQEREYFVTSLERTQLVLRYVPSRVDADVLELGVSNGAEVLMGLLRAEEADKETFGLLSELFFEIQRLENRDDMKSVVEDIIRLLPAQERERWEAPRSPKER